MAIKLFLTYIGIFFACSVVLTIFAKQFSGAFAAGGSKPVISSFLISTLGAAGAYAMTLIIQNMFLVYWILAAIFLLLGIFQASFINKKYFSPVPEKKGRTTIGEIMFGLSVLFFAVVAFSALQYFFNDRSFLFYPTLFSGLFFFIPTILVHTFHAAYKIPQANYTTWQYPEKPIDLPEEKPNERLLVIGFEIAKKETDSTKTYFRAKAPDGILLGELFYHFINDYNELQSETPIQFEDKNGMPNEWWFRIKPKWYQFNKILDPNETVKANGIKENSVIICERIQYIEPPYTTL